MTCPGHTDSIQWRWDSCPPVSELLPPPCTARALAAVSRLSEVSFLPADSWKAGMLSQTGLPQACFNPAMVRRDTSPLAGSQGSVVIAWLPPPVLDGVSGLVQTHH